MFSITGARLAPRRLCAAVGGRMGGSTHVARTQASLSLALLASSALLACSEGSSDPLGAAGTSSAGSAGTSGGQTGTSGTGGGTATAGTSAGGTAGGGSGGAGQTAEPLILFDIPAAADVEAWQFAFADPADLVAPQAAADAGDVAPPEGNFASAEFDSTGDPNGNAGSIRLELPFSGPAQKISFEVSVATDGAGADLAGRSVSARLSVVSGYSTDPMNPPGLKLYVKTGDTFFYADSGYINIAPGSDWQTFTWANISNPQYPPPPSMHAPTDVRLIGIEFDTGSAGVYSPATLLLDTVAVY